VEDSYICPKCLKEYTPCDKCGGYFSPDVTPAYHLNDGRTLCEDCALYDLNSGDLDEDDIESIDGEEDE
jgi:formylmethanofuran dehydrogenase subunit E